MTDFTDETMKKIVLFFAAAAACACLVSCNNAVPFQSLPAPAQTFLSTHYADMPVPFAKAELFEYEVVLPNGTEIEFSKKGEWKKIDADHVFVPAGVIATLPSPIGNYLTTTFAGIPVEKMEKCFFGGYELELVNDAELKFSKDGVLKSCSF